MRPRPERVRTRPRPKKIFEAEATVYDAEARHVREQLSVHEHEDYDIGVQNIIIIAMTRFVILLS